MSHPVLTQNLSLTACPQALISGQITDALTGSAINSSEITLALRLPNSDEFQPWQIPLRRLAGGYFCVIGVATDLLPQNLPDDTALAIRFQISAPGYQDLEFIAQVSASAVTANAIDTSHAGHTFTLQLIDAPALHQILTMTPVPVGMRGRVIEDQDPQTPVAGASVQVIEPEVMPAVISDAQGRFAIVALPSATHVRLRASTQDNSTEIDHLIDYSQPINQRTISLNG